MTLFQAIFVPLCGLAAVAMFWRTMRSHGLRRNGLFWTAVWFTAAFLILFPSLTTTFARWFGIGRGADLILYVAILAGLTSALFSYIRYRRLEIMVTEIIRREALASPHRGPRHTNVPQSNALPDSASPEGATGERRGFHEAKA